MSIREVRALSNVGPPLCTERGIFNVMAEMTAGDSCGGDAAGCLAMGMAAPSGRNRARRGMIPVTYIRDIAGSRNKLTIHGFVE